MAQTSRLPTVTATRLETHPGQEIDVHVFLRGLKRPSSRAVRTRGAHDGFFTSVAASTEHYVPKYRTKLITSPKLTASDARDEEPIDKVTEVLQALHTIRTNAESVSFTSKAPRPSSPLLAVQDDELASEHRLPDPKTDILAEQDYDRTSVLPTITVKERQPSRKQKKKSKRRAPVNELALAPSLPSLLYASKDKVHHSPPVVPSTHHKAGQPLQSLENDSDAIIDEIYDDAGASPLPITQSFPQMRPNPWKPSTRSRKDSRKLPLSPCNQKEFKLPPLTPKRIKNPKWKPGSGFEGIALVPTRASKTFCAQRPEVQRTTYIHSRRPSTRSLRLSISTGNSPGHRSKGSGTNVNAERLPTKEAFPHSHLVQDQSLPINLAGHKLNTVGALSRGQYTLENVQTSSRPQGQGFSVVEEARARGPSIFPHPSASSNGVSSPNSKASESLTTIRPPSKSEQTGWLRRPTVDSGTGAVQDQEQGMQETHQEAAVESIEDKVGNFPGSTTAEDLIQAQDHATLATQQKARGPEVTIQHQLPETSLRPTDYFSKATFQLNSPDKLPYPTSRRKSHRQTTGFASDVDENLNLPYGLRTQQGVHCVNVTSGGAKNRSRTYTDNLEMGMTRRLTRTMSSIPFRPPFKVLP